MTVRRPSGPIRLVAGVAGGLAVAAGLVACNSSTTTGAGAAASSSASSVGSSSASRAARGARPAASGTIAALAAHDMEVQSPQSGQVTVTFGGRTSFTQTAPTTRSAVVVGACVMATTSTSSTSGSAVPSPSPSPSPSRVTSFVATTVAISTPVNGTCSAAGLGGGGFGPGRSRAPSGGGTPPSGVPSGARPSGGAGRAGVGGFGDRAAGKVSAVDGATVTIAGTQRSAAVSYTVTLAANTVYTRTGPATSAALAVGRCVVAFGTISSSGAVAATRIAVSRPTSTGCGTGFGRGRPGASGGVGG
jgi:Domain of unknown function (DUF5666)